MLLQNQSGGYGFLPGLDPYSGGVIAAEKFTIEHIRLLHPIPWRQGFELIDAHLHAASRPRQALCAVALRSPKPFSFGGFNQFNGDYIKMLKSWDLWLENRNPVARTNVAPEHDPPPEPCLYSFAITHPTKGTETSFVVAGAGELPEGSLDPHDVVRRGDTSRAALSEKARFVLALMKARLEGLGTNWDHVSITNVYTVHDLNALLASDLIPRLGPASRHGVTWHYTRPPIESIEFEMDLRSCPRETVLS